METEALFKNSRICLLIVCSYWLSHYWRRAQISGCERGGWGQGYNTEHLSLLFSGSLCSTLPLDTGIKVSWPFFPDRCSTALVRWHSLTFGNWSMRFSYFTWPMHSCVSRVRLRLQVKTIMCNVFLAYIQQRGMLCSHESICCNECVCEACCFLRLTDFSFDTVVPNKKALK